MNLLKEIENLKDFSVNVLKEMISIPTTVPPGENYKEFVEYASSLKLLRFRRVI